MDVSIPNRQPPQTIPTQKNSGSLPDMLKDWMDTLRDSVPEIAEANLAEKMKQSLFKALLESQMSSVVDAWVQR